MAAFAACFARRFCFLRFPPDATCDGATISPFAAASRAGGSDGFAFVAMTARTTAHNNARQAPCTAKCHRRPKEGIAGRCSVVAVGRVSVGGSRRRVASHPTKVWLRKAGVSSGLHFRLARPISV